MRITKKVRRKKREMWMVKKKNNKINKQTKERNLSFKSLSHGWTLHIQNVMPIIDTVILYPEIPFINVTEIT